LLRQGESDEARNRHCCPRPVHVASFPVPYNFGWIFINMNTTVPVRGNAPLEDPAAAQAWMTTSMRSTVRFSVGHDAFQVDSACSASHQLP